MKKTKPISKRVSPPNTEKPLTPPPADPEDIPEMQNKSSDVLDSYNKGSDTETDSLEENAETVETISKHNDKALLLKYNEKEIGDDHEINEEEASKIVFDIMDEQYDDVIPEIESQSISKPFTNTTNCNNIQLQKNIDNKGKVQNDSTKYLFELIFKVSKSNVNKKRGMSLFPYLV